MSDHKVVLIQQASHGHRTGGHKGGVFVPAKPARIAVGGVVWTSPVPDSRELADYINGVAERVNQ